MPFFFLRTLPEKTLRNWNTGTGTGSGREQETLRNINNEELITADTVQGGDTMLPCIYVLLSGNSAKAGEKGGEIQENRTGQAASSTATIRRKRG